MSQRAATKRGNSVSDRRSLNETGRLEDTGSERNYSAGRCDTTPVAKNKTSKKKTMISFQHSLSLGYVPLKVIASTSGPGKPGITGHTTRRKDEKREREREREVIKHIIIIPGA